MRIGRRSARECVGGVVETVGTLVQMVEFEGACARVLSQQTLQLSIERSTKLSYETDDDRCHAISFISHWVLGFGGLAAWGAGPPRKS